MLVRIACVGHSLIHVRQQNFLKVLASKGHDVMACAPDEWNGQHAFDFVDGRFSLCAFSGFGQMNPYQFSLLGLGMALQRFAPDVVYAMAEPGSILLDQCHDLCATNGWPYVVFTWENIALRPCRVEILKGARVWICGNDQAAQLVSDAIGGSSGVHVLPQVGVDVDHFQARPGVERSVQVGYAGRMVPEKGFVQAADAYPMIRALDWKPYLEMPWWLSTLRIIVCFSQDVPHWKEQAMPYIACEAICCGAVAVVSDGGSIPFWQRQFAGENPGAVVVSRGDVLGLRRAISDVLADEPRRLAMVHAGRDWVTAHLGSSAIAERLLDVLS